MESANSAGVRNTVGDRSGILYPVMLIAAIAVIVFSIAGIATTMGWMPGAHPQGGSPAKAQPASAYGLAGPGGAACADCGVVESIRAVEVSGEASGAGAGAYAGQPVEKNAKAAVNYQIGVRMSDGTLRTLFERARPAFAIGQKVRVTEQGIVAAG